MWVAGPAAQEVMKNLTTVSKQKWRDGIYQLYFCACFSVSQRFKNTVCHTCNTQFTFARLSGERKQAHASSSSLSWFI